MLVSESVSSNKIWMKQNKTHSNSLDLKIRLCFSALFWLTHTWNSKKMLVVQLSWTLTRKHGKRTVLWTCEWCVMAHARWSCSMYFIKSCLLKYPMKSKQSCIQRSPFLPSSNLRKQVYQLFLDKTFFHGLCHFFHMPDEIGSRY